MARSNADPPPVIAAPPNKAVRSYRKTTAAAAALAGAALLVVASALAWLRGAAAAAVALPGALVAAMALVVAAGGIVVLQRSRRAAQGAPDLYLELNRSRDVQAVQTAHPRRARWRRWLARRWLGHDLLVGDWVDVKSWDEIRATLDDQGCLEQLPFMPEMLAMCGRRVRVFRCMHRLFDYRKTRKMRQMDRAVLLAATVCDGSAHGGCEAACHTVWKASWLRRVSLARSVPPSAAPPTLPPAPLLAGTRGPSYRCQLTQLNAASQPIEDRSLARGLLPLLSGNVAPGAFVVAWLTHLFNQVQHLRGGDPFPAFDAPAPVAAGGDTPLAAGDMVVVRSSAEIRATLNAQSLNRGLYFEPDMLKHCGQHHRVQAEVTRLIDIVTGEMRTMKTPAYMLEGVHFSGERQLFNAQHEPLFWRAVWLRRDVG